MQTGSRLARLATVGLLATLGATACSSSNTTEPPPPQNAGTIRIENGTNGKIIRVFFKECGTSNWGVDRLPSDPVTGVIEVGATRDFSVEAGCYDLRADHLETSEDSSPLLTQINEDFTVLVDAVASWLVSTQEEPGPQ